ncbi:MAG: TrmO family methyltransferase, partial [Rariglobus sp.]
RSLLLGACDLVDGTPVFDVKPYVPAYDSFPDAKAGWIDEVDALVETPPRFEVKLAPLADTQATWLRENWQVDFVPRLVELLSRDPSVHRTRRIRKRATGGFEIGCGAWRATFDVEATTVTVNALETGYPLRFLTRDGYEEVPDREAQMAFLEHWPEQS